MDGFKSGDFIAVVRAYERSCTTAVFDDGMTPVATNIREDVELPILASNNHEGLAEKIDGRVVSGLGQGVPARDRVPGGTQDALEFQLENRRISIALCGQAPTLASAPTKFLELLNFLARFH